MAGGWDGPDSEFPGARTYFPDDETLDLAGELATAGGWAAPTAMFVETPDGTRIEVPGPLRDVLLQAAEAFSRGMAVTVVARRTSLTTQQAADHLGVDPGALELLLEGGEIPAAGAGRRRYVQLGDLVGYADERESRRRDALDAMAREAEEAGLYEATGGRGEQAPGRVVDDGAGRHRRPDEQPPAKHRR